MKKLIVKIPIFNSIVTILQSDNIQEVDNYICSVHNCPSDLTNLYTDDIDGKVFITPDNVCYIWIQSDSGVLTLIHEIGRAVYHLMRCYGLEGEEIFLYLQDYILKQVICTKPELMEVLSHLSIVEDTQQ